MWGRGFESLPGLGSAAALTRRAYHMTTNKPTSERLGNLIDWILRAYGIWQLIRDMMS
jgi:hypothetical protein